MPGKWPVRLSAEERTDRADERGENLRSRNDFGTTVNGLTTSISATPHGAADKSETYPRSRRRQRRLRRLLNIANVAGVLLTIACAAALLLISGCRSPEQVAATLDETVRNNTDAVDQVVHKIDHQKSEIHQAAWSVAPKTIRHRDDLENITYRDLTLDEVLRIALRNSDVLRELGGTILSNPDSVHSRFTRALNGTDPRYSPEAALAAFDAQLRTSAYFSNNDQLYNNPFFAGGTNAFKQDLHEYQVELSKMTATGSQMALRSYSLHNSNNAPGNIFGSAWDTYLEGEIRKPLMQGGGLQFNQIAGPGSSPGVYNGVRLAKVSSDMDQTDFEIAVRDYVNNMANTYWDLYFAYRDLDARSKAMGRSLEAWNRIKALSESDLESGAAEALAREQYYRFKSEVDEAVTGHVTPGTRTRGGSTGGTLEGAGGVQTTERRLRLLMGLPITDGELIRPSGDPTEADVVFDWDLIQTDALSNRPELRRQQMAVRRRELELIAAKNFLNPRLDAVGRYRFRGFGDDLIRTNNGASVPASALRNLMGGDQQEWFVGFEYEVPIGYRRAHLAVNNAEIHLSRERIIHREQQRNVVHDLTNAVADAARAYEACHNSMNRYLAASELLKAYEVQDEQDIDIDVDHLLDAQRRVAESEIRYYRARTEYAIALKNVHLEKGSLLAYHDLQIFDHQTNVRPRQQEKLAEEETETLSSDITPVPVAPELAGEHQPGHEVSGETMDSLLGGPMEALEPTPPVAAQLSPEEINGETPETEKMLSVKSVDPDRDIGDAQSRSVSVAFESANEPTRTKAEDWRGIDAGSDAQHPSKAGTTALEHVDLEWHQQPNSKEVRATPPIARAIPPIAAEIEHVDLGWVIDFDDTEAASGQSKAPTATTWQPRTAGDSDRQSVTSRAVANVDIARVADAQKHSAAPSTVDDVNRNPVTKTPAVRGLVTLTAPAAGAIVPGAKSDESAALPARGRAEMSEGGSLSPPTQQWKAGSRLRRMINRAGGL